MQKNQLKPNTKLKPRKRVGRGGKRGKTSGAGHKGQKARGVPRPALRDIIKRIPKKRGYGINRNLKPKAPSAIVSLAMLDKTYKSGETVSPATLLKKGLIDKVGKRVPKVKILGGGNISKKLVLEDVIVSKDAESKLAKV